MTDERLSQLRAFMEEQGLTRARVAQLLDKPLNSGRGTSNSTVDKWLSGANPVPFWVMEVLPARLAREEGGAPSASPSRAVEAVR